MNYQNLFLKNMNIALAINEGRNDMRSYTKCVAIFLYKKRIISIGINKNKTHPILLKFSYDKFKYFSTENINILSKRTKKPQYPIHAELDGYIKALHTGSDFDSVFLYRGNNCDLACEPCCACSKWLRRINRLTICFVNKKGNLSIVNSYNLIGHLRREHDEYKRLIVTEK